MISRTCGADVHPTFTFPRGSAKLCHTDSPLASAVLRFGCELEEFITLYTADGGKHSATYTRVFAFFTAGLLPCGELHSGKCQNNANLVFISSSQMRSNIRNISEALQGDSQLKTALLHSV